MRPEALGFAAAGAAPTVADCRSLDALADREVPLRGVTFRDGGGKGSTIVAIFPKFRIVCPIVTDLKPTR